MRCVSCMREIDETASVCGFCQYPQDAPQENADALRPGTVLRDRFLVGKELGRGGFGITYIGYDQYLECRVAIKEYYPQSLAARLPGEDKIFWRNSQLRDSGCRSIMREAQKMHRLGDLPVAVRVQDVFCENNTAYIAMDYVEGITLKEYLLKNGILSPESCLMLMMPVLDTMIQMHKEGIIHRDISPDNIMIQPDQKPRLLDLGAAKDTQMTTGTTMLVARNGFSPWEQYQTNGSIGPWTDVYALCATMYYCLTGRVPPSAIDRMDNDNELVFRSPYPLPEKLCDTLRNGMRVSLKQRIPDMTELKRQLEASRMPDVPIPEPPVPKEPSLEAPIPEPPVSRIPASRPAASSPPIPAASPASVSTPPAEKPKGRLSSLFARFGPKNKPSEQSSTPRNTERHPVTVVIAQPSAFPQYADPNATVCQDEEGTVLFDEDQPTPAKAYLIQRSTGKRVPITKCCFTLGRRIPLESGTGQVLVDYMIADSTKHISRKHAAIVFDGASFYLQDISARNSTLLNGIRIQNGAMPDSGGVFPGAYPLYDGDSIQLATETFTFHVEGSL